jgi:hypothetical protein
MAWGNFQFINKHERAELLRVLDGGESPTIKLTLATPEQLKRSRSVLIPTVSRFQPATVWYALEWTLRAPTGHTLTSRTTWLGKISHGAIALWRNGNDYGKYNYAIYQFNNRKFYFRKNNKEVMDLLEILVGDEKNLPLLISKDMCS